MWNPRLYYALLLDPGFCLRAHIVLIELVELVIKKKNAGYRVTLNYLCILPHSAPCFAFRECCSITKRWMMVCVMLLCDVVEQAIVGNLHF